MDNLVQIPIQLNERSILYCFSKYDTYGSIQFLIMRLFHLSIDNINWIEIYTHDRLNLQTGQIIHNNNHIIGFSSNFQFENILDQVQGNIIKIIIKLPSLTDTIHQKLIADHCKFQYIQYIQHQYYQSYYYLMNHYQLPYMHLNQFHSNYLYQPIQQNQINRNPLTIDSFLHNSIQQYTPNQNNQNNENNENDEDDEDDEDEEENEDEDEDEEEEEDEENEEIHDLADIIAGDSPILNIQPQIMEISFSVIHPLQNLLSPNQDEGEEENEYVLNPFQQNILHMLMNSITNIIPQNLVDVNMVLQEYDVDQMKCMKYSQWLHENEDQEYHPTECTICLEKYSEDDVILQLPRCIHIYHNNCIRPWLLENSIKCPVCRTEQGTGIPLDH
jgi:hypothetical protein